MNKYRQVEVHSSDGTSRIEKRILPDYWVSLSDEYLERMAEKYVTNFHFDTLKYGKAIQEWLKRNNT
jgi:hypothetical protein